MFNPKRTAAVDLCDSKGVKIKTFTLGSKSSGGGSLKHSSGKDIGVFTLDLCEVEDLMN
jgi:aspartyl aminopeptidase